MAKQTKQELALAKENRQLIKNLKRRLENIKKRFGSSPASDKLDELGTPLKTKGLTLQQLKDQKRDLLYVQGLRTSYIKGMKNYKKHWEKVEKFFDDNGQDVEDKFWEIYNKFVEEHAIMYNYKYEITDEIYAGMNDNLSEEEINKKLNELFEAVQYGENPTTFDSKRLFYIPKHSK